MSTDPIRLTDATDAVPVIADPSEPQHQGRKAYGHMQIGQAYLVERAEAERLIRHKGFTKLTARKLAAAKPTTTTPEE